MARAGGRSQFVDSPDEPLYTNQIKPYDRAPHLFVGFPTRYVEREWSASFDALPDPVHRKTRMKFVPRYGTAVTDCQFMTSRDGRTFHRWDESFLRPGSERKDNWLYGDCYPALGILETQRRTRRRRPSCRSMSAKIVGSGPVRSPLYHPD